jgi:hypothetical protein
MEAGGLCCTVYVQRLAAPELLWPFGLCRSGVSERLGRPHDGVVYVVFGRELPH